MSTDLITISSSALPDGARVAAFRAVEAISRPYEVEVFIIAPSEELELSDAIGAKARLVVDRELDKLPPFYFSGVFASMELLHEQEGRALLRGVIVPRVWQLGLSLHSRIYTKMSVPEIIEAVLQDNAFSGGDYELRLGNYPKEEHVCQYGESDLAFLSRWMEREGIFYFFEHGEEGDKLVLCDDRSYDRDPVGTPVRYYPQVGGDRSAGASFRSFRCRHATLPATVKLKDYDYAKPNLDVSGMAMVSNNGTAEVSIHGDRFFSPKEGKRLAQLRAEELRTREVVFQATGTRFHLRPGYLFELDEHPRAAFNAEYLTIEAVHSGNQSAGATHFRDLIDLTHDDVYLVEVTAIPGKTQYRPERATPWPRIYGYENGIVDGAADSEYAQIDDLGRYSVKFRFDESALKNGKASTFVRMMQPHGGGIEGFHFPLRKGTEIVFSFLGGDPDRPVISGVVPNALTPSPVTSGNHTKNVIQTGGRNRLELEDLAGQQRVTMSTPHENSYIRMGYPNKGHHMIVQTDRNTLLNAGEDFDLRVGQIRGSGTLDAHVKNDWKTHVQTGGMAIGVVTGHGTPKAGAFGLATDTDISMSSESGNYSLTIKDGTSSTKIKKDTTVTVEAGKYEVTVTGADTKVENTDSRTTIVSQKQTTVQSVAEGMTLVAKQAVSMTSTDSTISLVAPKGDINISTPSKTITVDCTTFTDTSQEKKSNWGDVKDIAKGKWTVFKFGDWVEVGVSAKAELSASISMAAKLSVSLEFAKTIDLKAKFAKKEACMTLMMESPWIDMKAMAITFTTPLLQATSALKVL
ncbi:type VI secretion system Vgr family protein [Polyangium aurulentum]|uniref:type VI secretion system Vgr family protein n=1 Tax=Polyangium aurulentum TaxID=2567896 RepID=UPI0010AEDE9E|nr:type VI secretion system tip protein TssI/VgrG [Polyangium aurulentum]UQA58338.1 type VI secretion system tip protein VgrG [Polyangium aurulentum]